MAFDHADRGRITALNLRADDPPGEGTDRATRYANILWGELDSSTGDGDDGDGS